MHKKCSNLFILISSLCLLTISGCAVFKATDYEENLKSNIDFLIEQGKNHWAKRIDPEEAKLSHNFFSKAYHARPLDPEMTALYSRSCHFLGYYVEEDPIKKSILFLEGKQVAWDILENAADFKSALEKSRIDTLSGLENLTIEYVPLLYWYASNFSRYLAERPVIERLNNRDLIETSLHRIQTLDPNYFYGGPNRLFGGIFARLPGIDLELSYRQFELSLKYSPDYLGTYVLRAKYLHTKAGNREKFIEDLKHVIDADPTGIPEVMPENLMEQEIARLLLAQEFILFE